jgi:hypothetical protein
MTPFVNSNLTVEHCLHANTVVYNTICDILRKEEVDDAMKLCIMLRQYS